jgi:hypothetical protein
MGAAAQPRNPAFPKGFAGDRWGRVRKRACFKGALKVTRRMSATRPDIHESVPNRMITLWLPASLEPELFVHFKCVAALHADRGADIRYVSILSLSRGFRDLSCNHAAIVR